MTNLAEFVRSTRVEHGLSQKEFAEKIGASQTAVSYWESGKRQIGIDQIWKIAEAFNLNLRMLDLTAGLEEDEQHLLTIYNQLNEGGKAKAIDMLRALLYAQKYLSDDHPVKEIFCKNIDLLNDLVNIIISLANSSLDVK